jgi:hypothetical protein
VRNAPTKSIDPAGLAPVAVSEQIPPPPRLPRRPARPLVPERDPDLDPGFVFEPDDDCVDIPNTAEKILARLGSQVNDELTRLENDLENLEDLKETAIADRQKAAIQTEIDDVKSRIALGYQIIRAIKAWFDELDRTFRTCADDYFRISSRAKSGGSPDANTAPSRAWPGSVVEAKGNRLPLSA